MFAIEKAALRTGVVRYEIRNDGSRLSFSEAVELWSVDDPAFRQYFIGLLRECDFDCYRFETPPLTESSKYKIFQFVLIHSPEVDLPADPSDFEEQFFEDPGDVLVFQNLGGDATMIVPRPYENTPGYAHISDFVRNAPTAQQLLLWRTVGLAMQRLIGVAPIWLNTAGGGVPWLHVRLDSRPKYYVFDEYKRITDG